MGRKNIISNSDTYWALCWSLLKVFYFAMPPRAGAIKMSNSTTKCIILPLYCNFTAIILPYTALILPSQCHISAIVMPL